MHHPLANVAFGGQSLTGLSSAWDHPLPTGARTNWLVTRHLRSHELIQQVMRLLSPLKPSV
jgi:hypothetical protein